jgi:transposase
MKKLGASSTLRVCYEAGPTGYVLYWQLAKLGIQCEVVAPTLIPKKSGERVKTDRLDAIKLARTYRNGELTSVWIPDRAHEALRDLVRAREGAKKDELRARHRLGKFLLRQGRRPPVRMAAWGTVHMKWIRGQQFEQLAAQATFTDYLGEVDHARIRVERLERVIDEAVEKAPAEMREIISGLQALRGVAKLTAVTIATEVGRLSRFANPKQLMGYSGAVPREHSSGSRTWRGGITKSGNAHLRRVIVEASWAYRHRPALGATLKKRQQGVSAVVCEIAWKAQHRLNDRYRRLSGRGKTAPQVITAIARELLGFVWAIGVQIESEQQAGLLKRVAA